jgi:hypothetical protein
MFECKPLGDYINKFIDAQNIYDRYYKLVNTARINKTLFQEFGIGNEYEYLRLFRLAEYEYLNRKNAVFEINDISKNLLSRVDVEYIKNIRCRNFVYVYDRIKNNNKIRIIFDKDKIKDNIPIGFPILINNRDNIRKKLMSESIYCPIHWSIKDNYIPNIFNDAYYLSDSILTLPIDQRYNLEDMNRLVNTLCLYL